MARQQAPAAAEKHRRTEERPDANMVYLQKWSRRQSKWLYYHYSEDTMDATDYVLTEHGVSALWDREDAEAIVDWWRETFDGEAKFRIIYYL